MIRVTVVGSASTLGDIPFDGFVNRHVRFVEGLATRAETSVVRLQHDPTLVPLHPKLATMNVQDVSWPVVRAGTRMDRAKVIFSNLVHRASRQESKAIRDAVARTAPDVLLTLGPWLDDGYDSLYRSTPAVHLAEEDVFKMTFFSPSSLHGRMFRNAEVMSRRLQRGQPRHVVVISDTELGYAARRYPGIPHSTLPYTLDQRDWPLASAPSEGVGVLVTGVLTQERNSGGLVQLLEHLEDGVVAPPAFTLVSDAGLHPDLDPYLDKSWVTRVPSRTPFREHYRDARVCVVPALEASGMKTTILQAWATGLPVLTYEGSAATFPRRFRDALVVADSPAALAQQVHALHGDPLRCRQLAKRGLALVREEFDDSANLDRLVALLVETAGNGRGVPAR